MCLHFFKFKAISISLKLQNLNDFRLHFFILRQKLLKKENKQELFYSTQYRYISNLKDKKADLFVNSLYPDSFLKIKKNDSHLLM